MPDSRATTETVDPRFAEIDSWSSEAAIEAMLEGQLSAIASIKGQVRGIASASEAAAERLLAGGRLIYVGAGTSGRIAVQDGVELGPTFGWPADRLGFVLAGGLAALAHSAEGAEDDAGDAVRQIAELLLTTSDVVIGVAASGHTPFTVAAIEAARALGALTVAIANNAGSPLAAAAEHAIDAETGSEVVAGSTRMKAGTAQKAVLNLLSTAAMIRCGRVYRGLMVDMVVSNDKLRRRAQAMVSQLAACPGDVAIAALAAADDDIKTAVLIAMGQNRSAARGILEVHGDNLRRALESIAEERS